MESLLFLVMAIVTSLGVIGSGAVIHENAKDIEDAAKEIEVTTINTTNALIKPYLGENIRGVNAKMAISTIETANENEVFPIPISITYEEGLNNEIIQSTEYYKLEGKDELPQGNADGYLDRVIISKVK